MCVGCQPDSATSFQLMTPDHITGKLHSASRTNDISFCIADPASTRSTAELCPFLFQRARTILMKHHEDTEDAVGTEMIRRQPSTSGTSQNRKNLASNCHFLYYALLKENLRLNG